MSCQRTGEAYCLARLCIHGLSGAFVLLIGSFYRRARNGTCARCCRLTGSFTAESSNFTDNKVGQNGGAIQLQSVVRVNFTSCLFTSNYAAGEPHLK